MAENIYKYLFFIQIKKLGPIPIVKPSWITDSIDMGKLLNYQKYLLYTNQSTSQPALKFGIMQGSHLNEDILVNEKFREKSDVARNKSNVGDSVLERSKLNPATGTIEASITKVNITNNDHSDVKGSGEVHNAHAIFDPISVKNCQNENQHKSEVSQGSTIEDEKHCSDYLNRCGSTTKTAADPNFLTEFYNNSRLHLISTLGAHFKQLVNELRDNSNGHFPGKEKLKEKGKLLKYEYE